MAPKKKAASGSAAAEEAEQMEASLNNFIKFYRRNCIELETPQIKEIKDLLEKFVSEGEVVTKVITNFLLLSNSLTNLIVTNL